MYICCGTPNAAKIRTELEVCKSEERETPLSSYFRDQYQQEHYIRTSVRLSYRVSLMQLAIHVYICRNEPDRTDISYTCQFVIR